MDAGREQSLPLTVAVSSGSGTGTIAKIWSICRRLRIIPPNENAEYTFSILDGSGYLIFKRVAQLGSFSDNQYLSLGVANSVSIESATVDGDYRFIFDMH